MNPEISYLLAMTVGFLGGVHCLGMCGGIVATLSLNTKSTAGPSFASIAILVAYNVGRIGSYVLAGIIAGYLGASALDLTGMRYARESLQVLAGVVMVLLGLYLAGWWAVLRRVEQAGTIIWRIIEPMGRRFIPVDNPGSALMVGLVWGWLPCGLVYSVLLWALTSGSATQGAGLMLAFGLGTLPNLLVMGLFTTQLTKFVQNPLVRQLAGTAVIIFGCYQIVLALNII